MNLSTGKIGPESKYSIEFESGALVLKVDYDGDGLDGSISVKIDTDYLLDRLAQAVPGTLDDSIISILKASLK